MEGGLFQKLKQVAFLFGSIRPPFLSEKMRAEFQNQIPILPCKKRFVRER